MPISIPFAQLQISPLPADAQQLSRAVLAGMWVNNEQRSFHTTHRDFVWEGGIGYPSNMLVVALSWTARDLVADQEIVQYAERKCGTRARGGSWVQSSLKQLHVILLYPTATPANAHAVDSRDVHHRQPCRHREGGTTLAVVPEVNRQAYLA